MNDLFRSIRLGWMLAGLVCLFAAPPAYAQGYDDQAGEHALFFNAPLQQVVALTASLRGLELDRRDAAAIVRNQLMYAGANHAELEKRIPMSNGFGGDTSLREAARAFADGYRAEIKPNADSLQLFAPHISQAELRARLDRVAAGTDSLSLVWRAALLAYGAQHQAAYATRRCDRLSALMTAVRERPIPGPQYLDGREVSVIQRDDETLPSYLAILSEAPVEHFDGALPAVAAFADQLAKCLPGPLVSSRHERENSSGFAIWYLLTPSGTLIHDDRAFGEAVQLMISRQGESAIGGPKTVVSIRVQGPR